jgi:DhnA family fructose-bisphosphate aldolase class Ia
MNRYLILGAIGFIIGWNIFLIQRDQKMFKAYDACAHTNCLRK